MSETLPAAHDTTRASRTAKHHSPPFSGRALAAFGVGLSFFVMAISGLMLTVAPRGRTAQAIDWHLAGLSRTGWEGVHLATSILFMIFAGWHFWVHLGAYRTLLFGTAIHPGGHRIEALVAVLAIVLVAAAAVMGWPPASWLIELNEFFKKEYWEPI